MEMVISLNDGKKVDAIFKGHTIRTDQPLLVPEFKYEKAGVEIGRASCRERV